MAVLFFRVPDALLGRAAAEQLVLPAQFVVLRALELYDDLDVLRGDGHRVGGPAHLLQARLDCQRRGLRGHRSSHRPALVSGERGQRLGAGHDALCRPLLALCRHCVRLADRAAFHHQVSARPQDARDRLGFGDAGEAGCALYRAQRVRQRRADCRLRRDGAVRGAACVPRQMPFVEFGFSRRSGHQRRGRTAGGGRLLPHRLLSERGPLHQRIRQPRPVLADPVGGKLPHRRAGDDYGILSGQRHFPLGRLARGIEVLRLQVAAFGQIFVHSHVGHEEARHRRLRVFRHAERV